MRYQNDSSQWEFGKMVCFGWATMSWLNAVGTSICTNDITIVKHGFSYSLLSFHVLRECRFERNGLRKSSMPLLLTAAHVTFSLRQKNVTSSEFGFFACASNQTRKSKICEVIFVRWKLKCNTRLSIWIKNSGNQ